MHDPALTQQGYAQCDHLKNVFPRMEKITHMFCSPMIRTIATALIGFDPVFDRGLKVIAWDDLREWGKSLCSTGTSLEILKEALEGKNSSLFIVKFSRATLELVVAMF
jgi:broad specificity phosphatase PhoE